MILCDGAVDLRLGRWQDVLADVVACDALVFDAPYSDRTHSAYREMEELGRASIAYAAFSDDDVRDVVADWSPRCRGWFVSLTDHVLTSSWERALQDAGRYVFAPLACVEEGSRVRMSGDGPSQWSVFAVVARPSTREMQRWGALRGAYVTPQKFTRRGQGESNGVMGSKPLHLMRAIVRDYTRPGDLVVDPFCGGGTTALACAMEGRRCITSEVDPETFEKARARLARGVQRSML